jgi:uncharacterized protein YraI
MANTFSLSRSPRSSHLRHPLAASFVSRLAHLALAVIVVAAIRVAAPQPSFAASPEISAAQACTPALVARGNTYMRLGPGVRYRILARLARGDVALVNGRLRNNSWYLVTAKGITGWVSRQLVSTSCMGSVPVVPAQPVQPNTTLISAPFTASPFTLSQGQCTTLSWGVRNVNAVFLIEGNGAPQGVAGESSRTVCPAQTTTYVLRTQRRDGTVFDQTVLITVAPSGGINPNFRADNVVIAPGQCTTLRWNINDVQGVWLWDGNNRSGVNGNGTQVMCPPQTRQYRLEVLQRNGVTSNFFVTVAVDAAGLTAGIDEFTVDNAWLVPQQCTGMRWKVSGAMRLIQLIDGAAVTTVGATGLINVCPAQTTTYVLRVIDANGRQIDRALTVNVNAQQPPAGNPTPIP